MIDTREQDRGAILILTLILTVVMAVIGIALARYASVGLRTSGITDLRSETNADGAAVVTWAMEELRFGNLDVAVDCPSGGKTIDLTSEGPINVNGSVVQLTCSSDAATGAFPVVTLSATATKNGVTREVLAVAQVAPPPDMAVRALDWSVDDVPFNP
jgi:hypothetical protein